VKGAPRPLERATADQLLRKMEAGPIVEHPLDPDKRMLVVRNGRLCIDPAMFYMAICARHRVDEAIKAGN
jgi:hypothetical protein